MSGPSRALSTPAAFAGLLGDDENGEGAEPSSTVVVENGLRDRDVRRNGS